jgi:hypothetical protein
MSTSTSSTPDIIISISTYIPGDMVWLGFFFIPFLIQKDILLQFNIDLRLLDINLMANLGLNKSTFGWWKFDSDSDSNPNGKNLLSWIVKPHT